MKRMSLAAIGLVLLAGPLGADTIQVSKDQPTIQAAIDVAKPGDTVLVDPGTYREAIRLRPGVIVRSAGDDAAGKVGLKRAAATILDGGGESKAPAVIMAEGAVLDGFTVTRIGKFDQQEFDKHHATQGEHLPDDRGAVGAGKEFPAVALVAVTATVRNCRVHDNGVPGIGCVGAKDKHNHSRIVNNIVFRNMGGGIGVADGAAPTVETNVCFKNLRGGIGNRQSAGLILRNECFDNVRAGIGIREGATPIVRSNKCYKNRRAGIGVRMEGTDPLIEDNDCYENAMAGIGVRDGAAPLLLRNRCYENTLAGIGNRGGAQAQIIGNHVHHNKKAGIGFEDTAKGKAVVSHNRVIDNTEVAIGVHSGWKVRIVENTLARDGGLPPIVMVFQGATADFCGNTIQGSGVAGIRVEGTVRAVNNKFICPTLRKGGGPPQFAVWGLPGSSIVLLDNSVQGWRQALEASKATVVASGNRVADYWQTGIRIQNPSGPVSVVGNVFWSQEGHAGVVAPSSQGIVENNPVKKTEAPK